jgi:hypothetical protein
MNAGHDASRRLRILAAKFRIEFCKCEGSSWILPHLRTARAGMARI